MRAASAGLISLLNSGTQLVVADLLTIVPLVGSPIRITSAQQDITITSRYDNAPHTFLAGGQGSTVPAFKRGTTKTVIGLEVDDLSLTIETDPINQVFANALSWPYAARIGLLDGATIVLERAFAPSWTDWTNGTLITFWGRISDAQPSRETIAITVSSEIKLLDVEMPRNTFQPKCLHVLYDTGCALTRASFATVGAVVAGGSASAFRTNLAAANGYYDLGVLTFTSGALANMRVSVKAYVNANGLVTPTAKLIANPAAAVTFSIVPGCDKTQGTCNTKFANLAKFRGYPYIPVPETVS